MLFKQVCGGIKDFGPFIDGHFGPCLKAVLCAGNGLVHLISAHGRYPAHQRTVDGRFDGKRLALIIAACPFSIQVALIDAFILIIYIKNSVKKHIFSLLSVFLLIRYPFGEWTNAKPYLYPQ